MQVGRPEGDASKPIPEVMTLGPGLTSSPPILLATEDAMVAKTPELAGSPLPSVLGESSLALVHASGMQGPGDIQVGIGSVS